MSATKELNHDIIESGMRETCNCRKEMTDIIQKALDKEVDKIGKVSFILPMHTTFDGKGLGIPFFYGHDVPVGKGGKTKYKESTVNIMAKYCPFCGQKYPDKEQTTSPVKG
jgi:hypothetical protein